MEESKDVNMGCQYKVSPMMVAVCLSLADRNPASAGTCCLMLVALSPKGPTSARFKAAYKRASPHVVNPVHLRRFSLILSLSNKLSDIFRLSPQHCRAG